MKLKFTGGGYYEEAWEQLIVTYDNKLSETFYVGPLYECPEDAIIGRDLYAPSAYLNAIKAAYEAGQNGTPLEIITE